MAGKPFTDDERRMLAALHATGMGRNEIAAEMGRSSTVISRAATKMGLVFDAARIAAAVEVTVASNKARRAELAEKLLIDAEKLRKQLFDKTTLHSFGGKDHTYATADLDKPLFKDQKDLVTAINVAVVTSLKLEMHDGETDAAAVGSLLGGLFERMVTVHSERTDKEQPVKSPRQQALEGGPITYG